MLRAQALKKARTRSKAAAKAAKAAAEAAANSGNPDVIVTNTNANNNNNEANSGQNPEVDPLTFGHQRAIAAVMTLIQVNALELASYSDLLCNSSDIFNLHHRLSRAQCGSSSSLLNGSRTPRPRI